MRMLRGGPRRATLGLCLAIAGLLPGRAPAQEADEPPGGSAEARVMERFLAVLEKAPRRGTALDRVYGYHVERGSLDGLVKRYEDRTAADPADGAGWLLLGMVEAQRGRDASAVAALRRAEAARPDDPLPPYYLGQALVLVGQPDTAVDAFERALARKPSRADLLEVYQALGRVHQRARRNDQALAVWARLEATFPDDNRVREQVAAALAEEDQPALALARYEVLAREVKDEYRRVQFALEAAELKVRLARAPEALADFEKLLARLDPGSWLFREVRRKVEEVFLRGDDLAGLARYYEGWIARTPDDVDAMARLGRAYAQLGRAADSRSWLDRAVKLAPSRRDLRLALIEQLAREKKFAEASGQYEALVKAEPRNPDLVRDWGRLLLRDASRPEADRKAAAAAVWRRLAGDDVKDAVTVAQAADLFRSAEMVEDAIALYKRAVAMAPDSSQYREYLGEYYHQLKRPAEALATWRSGPARTPAEKGRLGEVLAGFGYKAEALGPLTDAARLAPDDFDLRLKLADLLVGLDRPVDALAELAAAGRAADGPEQAEAVLAREIHAYGASKTLGERAAALRAELEAGRDATAARWTRLARYAEADGKPAEAALAATKATAADPASVVAWATLGRLQEASGNLAAAAEANRKLAALDRRNRADYLAAIARLEARLGRTEEALKAGRELLAAAPGNIEHHQEFAELCFNLGRADEGLDALRRASRANPTDPKASQTLADALARQFRTEEAIELYWRAFDRTKELDPRLGVVSRLAEQYLQRNQFDRLTARLERELREPERKRELAICLAQAYQAAGDLGTARQQLESLLAANSRDSALLTQLANLAEAEGDVPGAARHLKQALEIAPTPEGAARLGNLHLRAGDLAEAEAVWSRLAAVDQDAGRAFAAIDSLLAAGKNETVLTLTERLLRGRPDDWDALYREGVALANLDRPAEAAARFARILELRAGDDDLAAIPRSRKRGGPAAGPAGVMGARQAAHAQFPLYQRRVAVGMIRSVARLDTQRIYSSTTTAWTPGDFGQARMAALAWLYAGSLKEKDPESWAGARRAEAERPGADPRALWDLFYLQLLRSIPREVFAASARLARAQPNDPAAQYAFLTSLSNRDSEAGPTTIVRTVASSAAPAGRVDKTPPLPPEDQALALEAFESIRKRRPDLIQYALLLGVATELKRAGREADAADFYRKVADSASTLESAGAVLPLAAERGDVDGLIALIERYERLAGASSQPVAAGSGASPVASAVVRAMGARAEARDHAGVLRLLDFHLAATARPDRLARRLKAKAGPASGGSGGYVLYTSKTPAVLRSTAVDFPTPNAYFDYGAIHALRNAFEVYRKDDLASDLVAHFRARAAGAPEDAKLYPTLATSYLLWWSDEKDEALKEYQRATEMARGDVELRLSLAELRAGRGEPAEALEAADSVEPLDQRSMQRRETLALRLAVLAGDVDRARKAAERLFGLRLDAETQVQLAAQMNQLGMHDLSEAVLARARRRSGGNAASLVALMLQYQRQGQAEVAVQVANQVLRQTGGARQAPPGSVTVDDQARAEAVQVLARSGRLKELIARAESQLATSPASVQLLQTLVDYYQADGQREKVKATYARIAGLRPDDAKLRLQVAGQLLQAGAAAEAIDHYRAALKKEPALFANQYSQIQRAFQQAGKADELAQLYESMDFRSFQNNPYVIQNTIQNLLRVEKTREQGLAVLRKAWREMPDARPMLLGRVSDDSVWKLPEIHDYAREAILPPAGKPIANPWAGMDDVTLWNGLGTVTNLATQLVESAGRQGKLDSLAEEVDAALSRSPDWSGGRALRAILAARRGRVDQARADLEPLARREAAIPTYARMVIAQELEKVDALRDVALKILEGAITEGFEELRGNGNGFQYGPGRRLALLYQKAGRAPEARELVLKYARSPGDSGGYDPGYASYQKVNETLGLASLLNELGYPADSARLYGVMANDSEAVANAARYYSEPASYFDNQIRDGLGRALGGMDAEATGRAIRTVLAPRADARPGEPRLDLVLLCHPRDLDQAAVTCLFAEVVRSLGDRQGLAAEARETLGRLLADHPDDLSVLAASAIFEAREGRPEALAPAAERLARLADARPLEPLPAHARANARQREEAARQLPLWAVARECVRHDATRSVGEKLAARALEAAGRQVDNRWSLAILRESGQAALDRGDRPAAEEAWRRMLPMVLAPPSTAKGPRPTAPPPASGAVATTPPATGRPGPLAGTPVLTLERFDQVAQLARFAADRGLARFSVDAAREALGSGPPVTPLAIADPNAGRIIRSPGGVPVDSIAQKVEEHLFALEASWSRAKADPVAAYEALRSAVLPPSRPGEVFLYARPLGMASLKAPRSVGLLLVKWAVLAGKADELEAAIAARRSSPLAAAPALVLLAQLESHRRKDLAGASKLLDAIREGVAKNGLAVAGEQACHAALPALEAPETAEAAARVIEAAIPRITGPDAEEPAGSLLVRLARFEFAAHRPVDGKRHLGEFLGRVQQSSARYSGDYGVYRRRIHLARIAGEFARAGLLDEAFDLIGQFADAPPTVDFGGAPGAGRSLASPARLLAARPPAERYRRLREWTLPTTDRKSVRWLVEPASDIRLPGPFPSPRPVADRGLIATPMLLIAAAREAGQLDALAAELGPLAAAKVENAARLLALVEVARGRREGAAPAVRARLGELKKVEPVVDPRTGRFAGAEPSDALLAREAMASTDPEVASAGEELASKLVGMATNPGQVAPIDGLRRDLARYRARRAGASGVATGPGLAFWSPGPATPGAAGEPPLWAESGGVVGHLSGDSGPGLLASRVPLSGTFEFSVDVLAGGGMGYGGLLADPSGLTFPSGVRSVGRAEFLPRPGLFARPEGYNRLTVRVAPGRVTFLVNGHLFFEDTQATPASPWLVLQAGPGRPAAFRDPTIVGRPEIPREVPLTGADSLDGWDPSAYGETVPSRRAVDRPNESGQVARRPTKPDAHDWHAVDGEIRGRRLDPSTRGSSSPNQVNPANPLDAPGPDAVAPSRLAYLRPLEPGESISFEFFHEPGESAVHPALGPLAFLIEPGGVRLLALVGGSEALGEPGPGQVLDDPAGRREPVALKAGDWNAATLRIRGSVVALEVNGRLAYERPLGPDDDRVFSLYHDKARTVARARNVVLRGDWPMALAADLAARPFASPAAPGDRATLRARAAVVDEPILGLSAGRVAREARGLPPADRYRKLLAWVLPGDDHASIRLAAEAGPTDPPTAPAGAAGGTRVPTAPTLDSPAIDLVAAATDSGELDGLAAAVEAAETLTPLDRRGRLALLAMVRDAQGRADAVAEALGRLRELARASIPREAPEWERWPELIAGTALAARPRPVPAAVALLDEVVASIGRDGVPGPMERRLRHARGVAHLLADPAAKPRLDDDPGRAGWVRATLGTAETMGRGDPLPTWTFRDGAWLHTPGHRDDLLFLATPLRGDFEVSCELTSSVGREARISYGGATVGILPGLKSYEVRNYGRPAVANGAIRPPLPEPGEWSPFRLEVRGGRMTAFVGGRKVHEQAVAAEGDPWLAIHAAGDATAGVRNLKVAGRPRVPERVDLSAASDLAGWLGDYYDEATQGEAAAWQKRGEEIVGRKLRAEPIAQAADPYNPGQPRPAETIAGGRHESVLRYARPLAEDGEVEYEFFHEPGKAAVHPALGRLALLLEPDGVKVHRITDGRHDRTGIDPGNAVDEPEGRRGSAKPPLKPGDWNRVVLAVAGDRLTLSLNGLAIFERAIESTNQRDFGFFRHADEAEARVRRVSYRGDWPRALPAEVVDRPATASSR